ncbi:uncharacterized protein LOC132256596 [Phlebotomus argentipes]|uniref:uncharacterized protein LOC132256596 n=1 Tax=Phlebotomus argentipes TaxID=94469 RepID=UPI0028936009|nr:uncharacterized protein LOC132256596 [Phlebotomus argentipes]
MSQRRVFKLIDNDQIAIQLYNKDTDLEGCMKVLREGFIPTESISLAVGLNLPEATQAHSDIGKLAQYNLSDGISLIARHLASDQIVGFSINKIHSRPVPGIPPFLQQFREENCHCSESNKIINFLEFADSKFDLFAKFNTECFMECVMLSTHPDFTGRKVGFNLVDCTINLAREISEGKYPDTIDESLIGKKPKVVFAIWTSKYSTRIGQKIGFKTLAAIPVGDLKQYGLPYPERIPSQHSEFTLSAIEI